MVPSTRTAAGRPAARREAELRWQMSRQSLDEAGLTNPKVREFVKEYAELTGAERIEVVNAADDARLIQEAARRRRAAAGRRGPLLLAQLLQGHRPLRGAHDRRDQRREGQGRLQQLAPGLGDEADARTTGCAAPCEGKTMYVIPYLMAPPGNALAPWAAGVELTDTRTVVLHMIRMSRVGVRVRRRPRGPRPASCAPST